METAFAPLALTRRQFAKGLAATAALGMFGTVASTAVAAPQTVECDVLVVGAGAAGVTAAYLAAQEGASVIVLEKLDTQRGSSQVAGGTLYGSGTKIQQAEGIDDDTDALLDYFLMRGGDKLDRSVQEFCAQSFGETIDWLHDEMGVGIDPHVAVRGVDPTPRAHRMVADELNSDGSYKYVATPALEKVSAAAWDAGAELRYNVQAQSLIVDDSGAVAGVVAVDENGDEVAYRAKKTIIATGGFCRNHDMVAQYMPDFAALPTEVGLGCTGEGLQMGLEIGAAYVGHGGTNGNLWCMVEPGVSKYSSGKAPWVTSEGVRFIDESCQPHDAYYTVAQLPDVTYYVIYDQSFVDEFGTSMAEKFQWGFDMGLFGKGDTVAEAAEALGLDGEKVQETFDAYTQMCLDGEDPDFGKDPASLKVLDQPPYYLLQHNAITHGSFGGYAVDTQMHVLDEAGEPIPNLFAAGEVSCGTFIYDDYPAGGCGLNWAYTSGRFAGKNAASEL